MVEANFLRDWTDIVRRIRLGAPAKTVALALVTYADPDGSRVFPGNARLSYVCEMSVTTVKTALRSLRKAGLIEKVGRRGDADQYSLIISEDLLERVNVPTPQEVNAELARIRAIYKGTYSPSLRTPTRSAGIDTHEKARTPSRSAETLDPDQSADAYSTSSIKSADAYSNSLRTPSRSATYQDQSPKSTAQSNGDQIADVLVPAQQGRDEDPISPPVDLATKPRCPHGRTTRHDNGQPRCVDCRAEASRITAEAVKLQLGPSKCEAHKRPIGKCHFCRRGLPGAQA